MYIYFFKLDTISPVMLSRVQYRQWWYKECNKMISGFKKAMKKLNRRDNLEVKWTYLFVKASAHSQLTLNREVRSACMILPVLSHRFGMSFSLIPPICEFPYHISLYCNKFKFAYMCLRELPYMSRPLKMNKRRRLLDSKQRLDSLLSPQGDRMIEMQIKFDKEKFLYAVLLIG